jgi:alpha-tubulin suppressor-like RCC1 family protein
MSLLAFAILMFSALSGVFAFTATVQTAGNKPIAGVAVTFAFCDTTVYSDSNGYVSLVRSLSAPSPVPHSAPASLRVSEGHIALYLPAAAPVGLHIYTLLGRVVFSQNKVFERGTHTVPFPHLAKGIYILKAEITARLFCLKVNMLGNCVWQSALPGTGVVKLRKTAMVPDTAVFAKSGYITVRRIFAGYGDDLNIVFLDSIFEPKPVSVSAGTGHTLAIMQDGTLWAWGHNTGELGTGDSSAKCRPVQVMDNVTTASAGDMYSMIIRTDKTLLASGSSSYLMSRMYPTLTPLSVMYDKVVAVSAGSNHAVIVKQDGTAWAAGSNASGQLGTGDTTQWYAPKTWAQVMSGVVSVSTGYNHSMFLKQDGTLWATGYNFGGQLGDGTTISRITPEQVISDVSAVSAGGFHTMVLKKDGTLWATGSNGYGQLCGSTAIWTSTPVQVMSNVSVVSAGYEYTMVVKNDGTLWAAGRNYAGQLGTGDTMTRNAPVQVMSGVSTVSAGQSHTIVIKQDGTLWAMGANNVYQLGDATNTDRHIPVQVIPLRTNGLTVSGGTGSGSYYPNTTAHISSNDSTAAGRGFSHWGGPDSALVSTSYTYSVNITMPNRPALIQAVFADLHSLTVNAGSGSGRYISGIQVGMIANDSSLTRKVFDHWGGQDSGFVLKDTDQATTFAMPPKDAAVRAMFDTAFVITFDKNSGDFSEANPRQTGLIKRGTSLWGMPTPPSWPGHWFTGWNRDPGGSGLDFSDTSLVRRDDTVFAQWVNRFTGISALGDMTMVVAQDGSLWATGVNVDGQLGLGDTLQRKIPSKVSTGVAAVSAGEYYTMILKEDHTLWGSGWNRYHVLCTGDTLKRTRPVQIMAGVSAVSAGYSHAMIIKQDGSLWAVGANPYGELGTGDTLDRAMPVLIMNTVSAVSAGGSHTMILKQDNTLWATGWNKYGQLCDGTFVNKSTPIQVMNNVSAVTSGGTKTYVMKQDGTLWESTPNGPAAVQNMTGVVSVAIGQDHTMFLKQDGSLWAMGSNTYGQLGDSTRTSKDIPEPVMGGVSAVSAGTNHTIILKQDGSVWGAGNNYHGQLGDGTTGNESLPVKIMPR